MIYLGKCWDGWSAHSRNSLWSNYPLVIRHGKSSIYRFIYIYIYLFIYLAAGDLYTFFWAAGLVLDTHLSFIVSFSNANIWSTKYENHSLEFLDDPLMILFQAISIKSYSKITFLLTVHTCPPVVPWQISPLKWGKTAWQWWQFGYPPLFFSEIPIRKSRKSCVSSGKSAFFGWFSHWNESRCEKMLIECQPWMKKPWFIN